MYTWEQQRLAKETSITEGRCWTMYCVSAKWLSRLKGQIWLKDLQGDAYRISVGYRFRLQ